MGKNSIGPGENWTVLLFSKDKSFSTIFIDSINGCMFSGNPIKVIYIDREEHIEREINSLSPYSLIHFDITDTGQQWLESVIHQINKDKGSAFYLVVWAQNPWDELSIHFFRDNLINDIRSKSILSEKQISYIIDTHLRSHQQFLEVKFLKDNLEKTIEERTQSLVQLNKKLQSAIVKNSNINTKINQQRIQIEQKNKEIEERNTELEKSFKKSSIQHVKLYKALNENEQQRRNLEEALAEIQSKNEKLQAQNEEIITQRDRILLQQQEIQDNIQYASYMQKALLPPTEIMMQLVPEHFVLNRPKDVVSGDFYWIAQNRDKTVIAVADCTGHGISGAMMSMLGTAFLNEIVNKNDVTGSSQILEQLRERIINSLHQQQAVDSFYSRDGMDISLCIIDILDNQMEYSGANNSVYIVRNGNLIELKPDKMPIGIHDFIDEPFTSQKISLLPNDVLYMFSDGFADQFGGKKGKKLKYARFKEILLSISSMPLELQEQHLNDTLKKWQGAFEQIDDILVFGYKIN